MDAKNRANFINSVAGGASIPCPSCGQANVAGNRFCIVCGAPLAAPAPSPLPSVGSPLPSAPAAAVPPVSAAPQPEPEEERSVFAQGLPDWSVEPPQVVVRRH